MPIKLITVALISAMLTACASTPKTPRFELPENAVAHKRATLSLSMIDTLDQYIEAKFSCTNWNLIQISESAAESQLVFTEDGGLYRGNFKEIWNITACNQTQTLQLKVAPNPSGGATLRIKPL